METAVQVAGNGDKAVAPTADHFLKRVRRRTRKKFQAEEKIRIIIEGMKREVSIADLCRREGISSALYYSWLKDFMEAGKARLKGDSLRQANAAEVKSLKRENSQLKELLAEHALQLALFKKSLSVSGEAGTEG
ncbi:MAG: transposase [Elusimicrobiota bacterium]